MTDIVDAEPVENASTELAKVMAEGDPDTTLAILEKKAELAPRWNRAINTILVTQTYPEDWTEQGGKMCLSSAGAERVARLFSIRFHDQKCRKEEFSDSIGKGYRYIYECNATLGDREVFAQGVYSTRDKFLGKKGDDYRPTEDINENNIRNAAYHICIGNAIKALLGLRGIPAERFAQIMGKAGEDATKAKSVQRTTGAQGGTSTDDAKMQAELWTLCQEIVNAGCAVEKNEKGYWEAVPMSDDAGGVDPSDLALGVCKAISSFTGKDGRPVEGAGPKSLKGKRLEVTLGTARKVVEYMSKEQDNG